MRLNLKHRVTSLAVVALATLVLPACEGGTSDPASADRGKAQALASKIEGDLAQRVTTLASERAERASIKDILGLPSKSLDRLGLRHVKSLRALYQQRKHRPAWIQRDVDSPGLSDAGEELRSALFDAEPGHGLWAEDYHVGKISRLVDETGDARLKPVEAGALTADERDALVEHLLDHPALLEKPAAESIRLLADADGPTPRVATLVKERSSAIKLVAESKARLDLFLSDALIQYGIDMKWSNPAWYADFEWPERLREKDEGDEEGAAAPVEDLATARQELIVKRELLPIFDQPARVATLLEQLTPPHDQYERLTKAYRTYRKIVAEGGWPKLPSDAVGLRAGAENGHVSTLKKRLKAEGFWQGDTNARFTRSLREAVLNYQRTHQLWEKGALTSQTRSSLNVPAHRRLVQIRLTLERWRNSRITDDETYVFINVPDFHAEVWDEGDREMRFKVVTGSSKRKWDREKEEHVFVNSTPLLSSQIKHLVFNPYWNVPEYIRRGELEPKLEDDPFYYIDHGYEVNVDEQGHEYLRQKPGPDNALGRVKFLFPNPYDVYLHDTNEKKWFKWPMRAFSHGCIRLEKPMELAQYLLDREDRWDEEKIGEFYEKEGETWLKLKQPVPVHIEYYVVRVDDLGRANFLADIYRYDGPRLDAMAQRIVERGEGGPALPSDDSDTAVVNTK